MRKHLSFVLIVALASSAGGTVLAQSPVEKADAARKEIDDAARRRREDALKEQEAISAKVKAAFPLTPLRVEVVVSRYQGEKRVSSLPYSLSINANSVRWGGKPSQLRMGGQIPVPAGAPPAADAKPLPLSVTYKEIGTNIDATASSADDGRYLLNLSIEDTSVYPADQATPDTPRVSGMPVFRSFRSANELLLRDGQSTQFTAATDRVSGEMVKIDVKLTVLK